ncbi:hypothetical protein AWB71_03127 [Caballeronia peredens]|nr:hypothetical protein AWB71_03127 [Caballeronia peredens]
MPQAAGVVGSVIVDRFEEFLKLSSLGRVKTTNPSKERLIGI